jgi:hypothetical protein
MGPKATASAKVAEPEGGGHGMQAAILPGFFNPRAHGTGLRMGIKELGEDADRVIAKPRIGVEEEDLVGGGCGAGRRACPRGTSASGPICGPMCGQTGDHQIVAATEAMVGGLGMQGDAALPVARGKGCGQMAGFGAG